MVGSELRPVVPRAASYGAGRRHRAHAVTRQHGLGVVQTWVRAARALAEAIQARIAALKAADPDSLTPCRWTVTASGSGLDPSISPAAPTISCTVARAHSCAARLVDALIRPTEKPWLAYWEPVVNVLTLNLALDKLRPA